MAIGDIIVTKGHILKLQSSIELHKSGIEPEFTRAEKEKLNKKVEHKIRILFARELEETLGFGIVDLHHDWAVYMEIHSVQK